jgi:hypothetical protein
MNKGNLMSKVEPHIIVSTGRTHAPGCINPETGQMNWKLMQKAMGVTTAEVADPATVPPVLYGTRVGQMYRILLDAANAGKCLPKMADFGEQLQLAYNNFSEPVIALLKLLEKENFISMAGSTRGQRRVLILATNQLLIATQSRTGKSWSDEELAALRAMDEVGHTFDEMADRFKVSRGTISGKLQRMPGRATRLQQQSKRNCRQQ